MTDKPETHNKEPETEAIKVNLPKSKTEAFLQAKTGNERRRIVFRPKSKPHEKLDLE